MKRKIISILFAVVLVLTLSLVMAMPVAAAGGGKNAGCDTIQDGVITYNGISTGHYLAGQPLQVGYDPYGYNYQAHMFNGYYANNYLGKDGFPPYEGDDVAYFQRLADENITADVTAKWYWQYRDVQLVMQWSDIWLSNKDCNNDNMLDRGGPGGTSSAAEGAWLTNHQRENGNWTYYAKFVYPPGGVVDVNPADTIDDNTGAPIIWGSYIVLQRVDSGAGATNYAQPVGFGAYK